MTTTLGLDRALTFINTHLKPDARASFPRKHPLQYHAVTISRQVGSGAWRVAEKLAALLQQNSPPEAAPWTIFDRNLMDKVLEDHHLPVRLAKYLPEDRANRIHDILNEVIGARPNVDTVIRQTSETILHLAELGNVIIIGRGGNIITARLPGVFHVRLVAPLEKRIEHTREFYNLTQPAARQFCLRDDLARKRYLKTYFGADLADALNYHLAINTGLVSYERAAELIAQAMRT
jgi:cytidylate kinase